MTIVVLRHSSAYCIRIALHTIQVKGERKGKERKQKLRLTSDFPHLKQINKAHSMPVMDSYRPALLLSCIICTSLENQLKPCCNGLRGINHYPIDAPVKIKVYDTRVLVKIEQHIISPDPSHRLLVKNWSERDVVPHIRRIIIIYPDSFSVPVSCFTPIPAIRIVISLQDELFD